MESVSLSFHDTIVDKVWKLVLYHLPKLGPIIHLFSIYFMFIEYLQVLSAICSVVTQR